MNFRVMINYSVDLFDTCILVIDGHLLSSCYNKYVFFIMEMIHTCLL